jgi:hypothetical protein
MKIKLWLALIILAFAVNAQAAVKQSAAYPGEVLTAQNDKTTSVLMYGVFYCTIIGAGVGNVYIQRSEDNTNWVTVKIIVKPDANTMVKTFYEQFGDESITGHQNVGKAYYRAILLDNPGLTSGTVTVRFAHWVLP